MIRNLDLVVKRLEHIWYKRYINVAVVVAVAVADAVAVAVAVAVVVAVAVAVAGCSSYLDRFTWRHDLILQFIANNLPLQHIQKIYADLPSYPNPSVITGDDHRFIVLIY